MQKKLQPYRLALRLAALAPVIVLGFLSFTNQLGSNPIQTLEHRTGDIALAFLLLSLSCTPLRLITKNPAVLVFQRPLGLYSFAFAAIHVLIFFVLDYGIDFGGAFRAILSNQFLWSGAFAFIVLLLLAVTSNERSKFFFKRNWKRIHSLIYPASFLVILHFGMSMKGDIFRLRGAVTIPLIIFAVWAILMIMRLRMVRR